MRTYPSHPYSIFAGVDKYSCSAAITAMLPKVIKDIADVEKAVNKELEESTKARGAQELTVGDIWAEQGL